MPGCVSRPLPKRVPVEELIRQAIERSDAGLKVETVDEVTNRHGSYPSGGFIVHEEVIDHEGVIEDGIVIDNQDANEWDSLGNSNESVGSGRVRGQGPPIGRGWPGAEDVVVNGGPKDGLGDTLIDDEFIETDVREVLLMMSEEAGVDLVMDTTIGGIVNARVDNMPFERAVEKVLMPLGLVFARRGNQFIVAPPDPASPLFSYIASQVEFRPRHVKAQTLVDTIPKRYAEFVEVIPDGNLIMIDAPPKMAEAIRHRFAAIDQPVPQVTLEAIICVVSPDSGFQFGLDWQHAVELNGSTLAKLSATGLALSGAYTPGNSRSAFQNFAQTSAFVKLLSENGYLTIRATPHVMAEDGQQANIAINRETFFSIQPPGGGDSSAFFFQQEVQKVESGITLALTPRVRGKTVTIDIEKAEVSEDIRNANTELSVNPFPIINRRSVSTTVHVEDRKTIVIGGLVQKETVDRVNRVPGLSKLPGLGYLFETTQRQTREAEVVIFISPTIQYLDHDLIQD